MLTKQPKTSSNNLIPIRRTARRARKANFKSFFARLFILWKIGSADFKTKFKENGQMKNFLSKHYQHYYIQTADGRSIESSRAECFAPSESPTANNPYKQRWFYDAEQFSYIIRLPRNEQGEALYRMNAASVKKEARYVARKYACILKGTGDCENDCDNCQRKRYSRIVELDKPLSYDDCGEPLYLEIAVTDEYYGRRKRK